MGDMEAQELAQIADLNLGRTDLALLRVLVERADENATCTISTADLADLLHVTGRTVQNARGRLEDAGHITVERRVETGRKSTGQQPNTYTIHTEKR